MSSTLQQVIMWVCLVLLIGCSAFFSSSETAISSVNRIRMKNLASQGNRQANRVLVLYEKFSRVLTGILIGNNIVNIVATTIGTLIFTALLGPAGSIVSTVVLTVVILMFGEVLPKSVAKDHAEAVSMRFSGALSVIVTIFTPLIFFFDRLKDLADKFTGNKNAPTMTEQELKVIIEEIQDEGVLEDHESQLVRSALDFDETSTGQAMTPRVDLVSIELDTDIEEVKEIFMRERYSRLPVYQKDIDNIVGVLNEKDFFHAYLSGNSFSIGDLVQKALFVSPRMNISALLKRFQTGKTHMAIVVDEYGGLEGVITLEDVFEQLVGNIYDEDDDEAPDVLRIGPNEWKVNPDMGVEDMFEKIKYQPDHLDTESNTVGGFVLELLEKLPEAGDSVVFERITITIAQVVEKRMLSLTVKLAPES